MSTDLSGDARPPGRLLRLILRLPLAVAGFPSGDRVDRAARSDEIALTPEPGFRFSGSSVSTGEALYYAVLGDSRV